MTVVVMGRAFTLLNHSGSRHRTLVQVVRGSRFRKQSKLP
jgi:hypothetical protein